MNCTKCGELIAEKRGYFRTKRGYHHFKCGIANKETKRFTDALIEQMIELYDHRGPAETKFEAMTKCAILVKESGSIN